MSRTLSTLAALVAAVLACTGLALIGSPADASQGGASAARLAPKPRVGQCRTTTAAQTFSFTDNHAPVACSQPHRLRTFAVVAVPKTFNYVHINQAKLGRVAANLCYPRFWKAIGGGHANRALTAYDWAYFGPSLKDRKHGARWLRCDVVLQATTPAGVAGLAPLPNVGWPMLGTRTITDNIRRCLATTTDGYWTVCSRPHVARADQAFVMASASHPTQAQVNAAAATTCPGKRAYAVGTWAWAHGDHVVTCYSVTTS
ncbi:MAG: septum formation family protein [Marmoricola sp.]